MTTSHPLAGFEFSPHEMIAIFAIISFVTLTLIVFASMFMAHLVQGARQLHSRGELNHPIVVAGSAMAALVFAFDYRNTAWAPYLLAAGLAIGYGVMLRAGSSWFRWTAVPSSVIILSLLSAR